MKTKTDITPVIFRKYKDNSIIALFPYDIYNSHGNIFSYMHVGQHGEADYYGVMRMTKQASENEFKELYQELSHAGYDLKVIRNRRYITYISQYRQMINFLNNLYPITNL